MGTDSATTAISSTAAANTLSLGANSELAIIGSNVVTVTAATLDVGSGSITMSTTGSIIWLAAGTSTAADTAVLKVASLKTLTSGYTGHVSAVGVGFKDGAGNNDDDKKTNIGMASGTYTSTDDNQSGKVYSSTVLTPGGSVASFITITVENGKAIITPKQSTNTISSGSDLVAGNS
jgi:hypothetical protein